MEDLNIPTENDDNEENEEVLEGGEEVSDAPTDEEKAVAASMSPTSSISATQRLQSANEAKQSAKALSTEMKKDMKEWPKRCWETPRAYMHRLANHKLDNLVRLVYISRAEVKQVWRIFHCFFKQIDVGDHSLHIKENRGKLVLKREYFNQLQILEHNAFRDRMPALFTDDPNEDMSFEELVDMYSGFSPHADFSLKSALAFCIYDFDGDGKLSKSDMTKLLLKLHDISDEEIDHPKHKPTIARFPQMIKIIIRECNAELAEEGEEDIHLPEFRKAVARNVEFNVNFTLAISEPAAMSEHDDVLDHLFSSQSMKEVFGDDKVMNETKDSHNPHRPPLLHKRMKLYAVEVEHQQVLHAAAEQKRREEHAKKKGVKQKGGESKSAIMLAEEEARYDMKKEEIDGFEDSEEIARVQEEIRKSVAHATPWNDLKDWVMVHLEVFHETDPVPLWRKALKKIDGNFGSGVAAVFRLYRWLFLMNTYISIVWLMFVIWPFCAHHYLGFQFPNNRRVHHNASGTDGSWDENIIGEPTIDGVNATDVTSWDWLFYGTYTPRAGYYALDMAYMCVIIILYVVNIVSLVRKIGAGIEATVKRQSENNIATLRYDMSAEFFGGYKHYVGLNKKFADTYRNGLTNTLFSILNKSKEADQWKESRSAMVELYFRRFIGGFLTFVLVTISAGGIILVLAHKVELTAYNRMLAPILLTLIKQVIPFTVKKTVTIEKRVDKEEVMRVTVFRVYGLKMFSLLNIFYNNYAEYAKQGKLGGRRLQAFYHEHSPTVMHGRSLAETFADFGGSDDSNDCPETKVGSLYLRLVVTDMVVGCMVQVSTFPMMWMKIKMLRKSAAKANNGLVHAAEEETTGMDEDSISNWSEEKLMYQARIEYTTDRAAQAAIDMMYRQALIWVGSTLCPILPVVGQINIAMIFSAQKFAMFRTCRPPSEPWSADRTRQFFMILVLVTLFICGLPIIGFLLFSPDCGPHKGHQIIGTYELWMKRMPEEVRVTVGQVIPWVLSGPTMFCVLYVNLIITFLMLKWVWALKKEITYMASMMSAEENEKVNIVRQNRLLEGFYIPGRCA